MNKLFPIFMSIFLLSSYSFADSKLQDKYNFQDSKLNSKLQKKYIRDLYKWIDNPKMSESSIRKKVQEPCSKLTMVMATASERKSFISHEDIQEYDFRAGFCMSAVIENVVPNQPGFTKEFKMNVCRESIPFIKLICKEFIKY